MLRWDPYGFHKKHVGTRYAERVFLHPVGYAAHVVHSGVSGARNIDAQFFMFDWDRFGFNKKCTGTRYAEPVFLHPVGSAGHVVHFGVPLVRNIHTIFQALVGQVRSQQKARRDTLH
jgi:hypothetical protein